MIRERRASIFVGDGPGGIPQKKGPGARENFLDLGKVHVKSIGFFKQRLHANAPILSLNRVSDPSSATTPDHTGSDAGTESSDTQHILDSNSVAVSLELDDRPEQSQKPVDSGAPAKVAPWLVPRDCGRYHPRGKNTRFHSAQKSSGAIRPETRMLAPPNLKKMLLLNGYPIAYIILWIPGIANRLVESLGTSPRWLEALQSSTQFIGLANALTYGLSEQKR
ncbi:hypothetical protein V493_00618 [Pseudogymnoascus sp. VKM F-4281 (FW-2241)]|nr:hypothetical protein V493_00618 [Pseudogymnoascus sp. VKM F-4281 (FW-2241)]